jgi:hypothetical protein
MNETNVRYPAQLPEEFKSWLDEKSRETGAPIAALLRGLPATLREAEQAGIHVQPVLRLPAWAQTQP